jgi:hypothetical protein
MVFFSVWIITFDLSGIGDPTSSYATAGIALRTIGTRKPHHYIKVGITAGKDYLHSFNDHRLAE